VRLSPEITAAGYRLITFGVTDSTNSDAANATREGDPGRLWIVAREQRAGRGRHGRAWASPPGNLYASLLLVEPCPPALAPQLGFIAGVALHEAVASATGLEVPRLALKWPNDLLLDGAKVAGVLLEGSQGLNGAFALALGFGVNVAGAPADTPYRAVALREVAGDVAPETLFGGLAQAFAKHFGRWSAARESGESEPFAAVRREWLARAAGLGDAVSIRLPNGERNGAFLGLDDAGRLQLGTASGTELIDAGDLYFAHLQTGAQAPSLRQVG
jgi:BirA family transcriptional regulator, biotin operon repressor / biotin---[acetyl-CoA-carboxylase] ligase